MRVIRATPELSDQQCKELRGKYLTEDHYDFLIKEDTDFYDDETGALVFKFRKKAIQKDLLKIAWLNCKYLAKASRGRGASAGPIDPEAIYWKKRELYWSKKWSAKYMVKDRKTGEMKESAMKVNNEVASNPIGFYGQTKGMGMDLPCRLTHYTRQNMENYENSKVYFQSMGDLYKDLFPEQYEKQFDRAKQNDFHIEGTPYSTITINRNFRTAAHQDSGDFGGWASLSVLEEGRYHGGYLVLPKYRIAIDLRHGDYLICDVHNFHANTELFETEEDKLYNDLNPQQTYKDNLEVGVLGLNNRFTRLSFVCYLREDLIKCKSKINKFVISLEDSERLKAWNNTEYIHWRAVNGKELSLDCEESNRMISYHNIRRTNQHLGKVGCLLSHLNLLKHIVEHKINRVIVVEDDALQVNPIPEDLPAFCYLGGWIANKKITSNDKISIDHKVGVNELDSSKYRMITTLSYYISRWEIAQEIVRSIEGLKRHRAIDLLYGNLIQNPKYIYPSVFVEEPFKSQIMNSKKNKFAGEYYKQVPYRGGI